MFLNRKAKGYFVSANDHVVQVARTAAPSAPFSVEELREFPTGDEAARDAALKQIQAGRSAGGYLQAVVGTQPARRLVRRHTLEPKRAKEPGYLAEVCGQQFRIEADKYALAVVSAADGTEFDPANSSQKDMLFCGLPTEDVASIQAGLLEAGIYPQRLEIGTVALLGGVADCLAHARSRTPVLVLELGADTTHTFIVTSAGVEASRPISHGHAAMVPLVQKELGLKDEEAARKLLLSNTFDFGLDCSNGWWPTCNRRSVSTRCRRASRSAKSSPASFHRRSRGSRARSPPLWASLRSAPIRCLGSPAGRSPCPTPWLPPRAIRAGSAFFP
jgi:hypothetical protein